MGPTLGGVHPCLSPHRPRCETSPGWVGHDPDDSASWAPTGVLGFGTLQQDENEV